MIINIKIDIEQGNSLIGYDYYKKLHGLVSTLMGNDCHGINKNKYTYSNFLNVKYTDKGINLKDGKGYFYIRTNDVQSFMNLCKNYNNIINKKQFYDISIVGITVEQINEIKKNRFKTLVQSPILVNGTKSFLNKNWFDDNDINICEKYLVNNVREKANSSGFNIDENLTIKIKNQKKHSDIKYSNIINKGRVFDLEINCNEQTKEFILLNGLGRSCGIGFGMIY